MGLSCVIQTLESHLTHAQSQNPLARMSALRHWWQAIRPKTLSISVTPVLVGTSLAWAEAGLFHWPAALAALVAALMLQIGTNLHKDAADLERGADTPNRLGPARATTKGWLPVIQIKRAALLSFAAAFGIGCYLAWWGGWPILLIGLASLAAGWAYIGGPRPIAYSPSGELFVFLFFGLTAVMGSYYLQAHSISLNSLFAACATGLPASAVLLVNNYRDLDQDRLANKFTLVHHLGRARAQGLYAALLLLPFLAALPLIIFRPVAGIALVTLSPSFRMIRFFCETPVGPGLNAILAGTVKLQFVFGLALSIGLLFG